METFASRLKRFIDAEGMTSTQFADVCKVPRPSLSQILSGRNKKISDILIGSIHSVFPNLNVVWLMFGEGSMYTGVDSPADSGSSSPSSPLMESIDGPSALSNPSSSSGESHVRPDYSLAGIQQELDFISEEPDIPASGGIDRPIAPAPTAAPPSAHTKMSFENPTEPVTPPKNRIRAKEIGLTGSRNTMTSRMNTQDSANFKIADLQRQIDEMRKNLRRVTQITVYYDDSTFETFVPKGR